MTERRPRFTRCANCNTKITVAATGRIPVFCSGACRQANFYKNSHKPLSADDRQRAVTWQLLIDAGLIPADKPMPMRKPENAA
jgi:hypothetical protein